eukprot:scaffold301117_cov30-Tisochrysis_lutea.AAC.2
MSPTLRFFLPFGCPRRHASLDGSNITECEAKLTSMPKLPSRLSNEAMILGSYCAQQQCMHAECELHPYGPRRTQPFGFIL